MEARVRDQGKHGLMEVRPHSNDASCLGSQGHQSTMSEIQNQEGCRKDKGIVGKNDTKGVGSSTRFVGI